MQKKVIIIISCILILIVLAFVAFILLFDTSDLECSRVGENDEEIFYFEFNWIGKVEKAKKIDYISFETKEEAQEYYNYYIAENFTNIELKENSVIFSYDIFGEQIIPGTSRKTLLNNYTDYGFECK